MAKSLVDKIVEVEIAKWDKRIYNQAKNNFEKFEEQLYENKMTFEEYLSKVVANEINKFKDYDEEGRI